MKRMNIWMLSALLALPASAQKITTQHEVVDCGQVVFRKPVTAEFVMKNEGSKPLVINNVLKSCGCTEVDVSEERAWLPAKASRSRRYTMPSRWVPSPSRYASIAMQLKSLSSSL